MIKSIYLENWKTHKNSFLEFNTGSNIIIGKIGSGKSSIVDAICYSFFGKFPSLSNKKILISEVIMFKPIKKKRALLKLEFVINEKSYRVERDINLEKSNQARLYLNDNLIAGPKPKDVNNKIVEILNINYNLFTKIIYCEQNEIDYFLKIRPSKRKEKFDELFGIIQLEDIKEDIRKLKNLVDIELDKQEALEQQLSSQLKSINIDELNKKYEEININLNNLSEENERVIINKKRISETLDKYKQKKLLYDRKNSNLNLYNSKLEETNFSIENLKKEKVLERSIDIVKEINIKEEIIAKKEKEYLDSSKENKQLEVNYNLLLHKQEFYKEQIIRTKTKLNTLEKSIFILEPDSKDLIENKEDLSKELIDFKQQNFRLLTQTSELDKAIIELSKGFAICPVCDSPLSSEQIFSKLKEKKLLREKNIELSIKTKEKISVIKDKLNKLANLENKLKNNEVIKKQITEYKSSLNNYTTKLKEFLEKINNSIKPKNLEVLEKELVTLKKELNILKDYNNLTNKKIKFTENIQIITKELNALSFNEDEYINTLSIFKNIEYKLRDLDSKSKLYNNLLSENDKQIEIYKDLINRQKNILELKQNMTLKRQDLSYFLHALENTQFQLRRVLLDNINRMLSLIWPKIYPYNDFISARMQASKDYILEVQTLEKEWIRVEGLLSGGERTCAALSIRIAITLILTKKLGLLILDEPTHNLDEKTVESLSGILDKQLPELLEQTFIVTHDPKLLETVNASKFLVDRDKENDGVSIIKKQ